MKIEAISDLIISFLNSARDVELPSSWWIEQRTRLSLGIRLPALSVRPVARRLDSEADFGLVQELLRCPMSSLAGWLGPDALDNPEP